MKEKIIRGSFITAWLLATCAAAALADDPKDLPKAFVDGTGLGWRALGEQDFVQVNCKLETWTWKEGEVHCTGTPVGVIRSQKPLDNFELVAQWRHLSSGGNSGIFVWASEEALTDLKPDSLPPGVDTPRFGGDVIIDAQINIIASCTRRTDRVAILDLPRGMSPRAALAYRSRFPKTSFAAAYTSTFASRAHARRKPSANLAKCARTT